MRYEQEGVLELLGHQPIEEGGGKLAGEVPRGEDLTLKVGAVLVHRERVVVVDEQRAQTQGDKGRAGQELGIIPDPN